MAGGRPKVGRSRGLGRLPVFGQMALCSFASLEVSTAVAPSGVFPLAMAPAPSMPECQARSPTSGAMGMRVEELLSSGRDLFSSVGVVGGRLPASSQRAEGRAPEGSPQQCCIW